MKYLVDVNVLSELTRHAPDARVLDWLRLNQPEIVVDPIILGEIRFGISGSPLGKRRRSLERWFSEGVRSLACVPWDAETGLRWGLLLADLRASGKPVGMRDSMIAATALVHDLIVVTRNARDFARTGAKVLDPFA